MDENTTRQADSRIILGENDADYLIIRGAAVEQRSPYDEWARDALAMLMKFNWKAYRLGRIVIVQHPMFCQ